MQITTLLLTVVITLATNTVSQNCQMFAYSNTPDPPIEGISPIKLGEITRDCKYPTLYRPRDDRNDPSCESIGSTFDVGILGVEQTITNACPEPITVMIYSEDFHYGYIKHRDVDLNFDTTRCTKETDDRGGFAYYTRCEWDCGT